MNRRKFTSLILMACIAVLCSTNEANACTVCMTAFLDLFLPPALFWCGFAIIWFLTVSIIKTVSGNAISGIPAISKSVILVLILLFAGVLMIGPFGILLLLLPYPVISWNVLLNNYEQIIDKKIIKVLKIFSIISMITLLFLITYTFYIKSNRSHSEFILKWESTYPAKSLIQELTVKGSENLDDLRIIVEKGNFSSASLAAEGLSNFGDPAIDIPILKQTLKKCNSDKSCSQYMKTFEQAIQRLNEKTDL